MNKQQELEERARAFYNSGAYDGDYDFSLSSACQFAAAFLIHDYAAYSQTVAPPLSTPRCPWCQSQDVLVKWTNGVVTCAECQQCEFDGEPLREFFNPASSPQGDK